MSDISPFSTIIKKKNNNLTLFIEMLIGSRTSMCFLMFLCVCVCRCYSCQRACRAEPRVFSSPGAQWRHRRGRKRKSGVLLPRSVFPLISFCVYPCRVSSVRVFAHCVYLVIWPSTPVCPAIHLPACCSVSLFGRPAGSFLAEIPWAMLGRFKSSALFIG